MNYLFNPRLTFTGTFSADVATVNNIPSNYDTVNFVPSNYLKRTRTWNSRGSGEWDVRNATVTQVCYFNGTCVAETKADPIVDADVLDGGNGTLAKLVDLDTNCQLFSEIWGWRIRIGNFFSGNFTPVPFQYIWSKLVNPKTVTVCDLGSAWQSDLTDIRWIDDSSPLIKEWKRLMKSRNVQSDKLSIRFNVDLMENDPKKSNFLHGRITGSIGLLGSKSPRFFTHGRMLHTQSVKAQSTPFIVEKTTTKAYIDFGNSFQITADGHFAHLNDLYVGLCLERNQSSRKLTCLDKFHWLGKVNKGVSDWYRDTSGIQSFPTNETFSDIGIELAAVQPFVVVEVIGNWPDIYCIEIILAEAVDGVDIHPYDDWTMREEPENTTKVRLLATKFGEPLQNAKVQFESAALENCPLLYENEPPVGKPTIPPPNDVFTNSDGIAEFQIPTNDPKNARKFIDGQIYPYVYYLDYQGSKRKHYTEMCDFKILNQMIVIGIWDKYGPVAEPTWLDHVYPIFKLYANLYPVMTANIIDLGNYYEVVDRKNSIIMSMELPISHPNYMPVTRDLSPSKRKVILDWLKKDNPPIGESKDFYTVENLRKDLQIALQLEQATIPPYLTAYASIKHNQNEDVKSILKSIFIQEMMHMNLVANILNAVGGSPVLDSRDFVPFYPTHLPGGIQPDLVVPIEKLSIGLIRNVFMEIEKPGVTKEEESIIRQSAPTPYPQSPPAPGSPGTLPEPGPPGTIPEPGSPGTIPEPGPPGTIPEPGPPGSPQDPQAPPQRQRAPPNVPHAPASSRAATSSVIDRSIDEDLFDCLSIDFKKDSEISKLSRRRKNVKNKPLNGRAFFPSKEHYDYVYERHHNTIGNFYNHIRNTLRYLTNCGRNNSIFTGDVSRQVTANQWPGHDRTIKVTDFESAEKAIDLIVEQGEGSSPCNPMVWTNETVKYLSHYFLFYSIAQKREIRVHDNTSINQASNAARSEVVDYTKECNGTYDFTGPQIPFDENGVWPMVPNPSMSKFKKGTKAYLKAEKFNKVYTKMLRSLQNVFNGHPDRLKDALGLMFSLTLHLKELVQTPIDPNGDPDVGPNAGPPFQLCTLTKGGELCDDIH